MPLDKRGKIFCVPTYLETKIIQNCLKIDATHYYENDLLLKQDIQKNIACPGSWWNSI